MIPAAARPTPQWSVVIPAYNASATIGRAIESVLRQTHQDFEIIVVDDGSSDQTSARIAQYLGDGRIRLLRQPSNEGLASALNRGLLAARGELLLHLDADDWLGREAVERLSKHFEDTVVTAVYGAPRLHNRSGARRLRGADVRSAAEHFSYMGIQSPRAFRVSALRRAGGWCESDSFQGRYYEDRRILARMHDVGSVRYADDVEHGVWEDSESLGRATPLDAAAAKLGIAGHEAAARGLGLTHDFSGGFLSVKLSPFVESASRRWSVIIPQRDRWELLEYALRSWAQSDLPQDAEIIVVDDGATSSAFDVLGIDPRIRVERTTGGLGPAAARNLGASVARGDLLFFSDGDHIVPPKICVSHERIHAQGENVVACGAAFAMRAFSHVSSELPLARRAQLARLLRTRPELFDVAARLLRGEDFRAFPADGDVWRDAQAFAVADRWAAPWLKRIIEYGENLDAYPHAWMRLGSGSLSLSRGFFERLGGFDAAMRSKEDWEFGIRVLHAGGSIRTVCDAMTLHQVHPVREERPCEDARGAGRLRAKHPDAIRKLRATPVSLRPPGASSLLREPNSPAAVSWRTFSTSTLAVTFDDGPHPTGTPPILDLLARHGARATFFVLGDSAMRWPAIVKRIAAEGHELAVHGWTHEHPSALSSSQARDSLRRTYDAIANTTGKTPRYYRPAYGVVTPSVRDAACELDLRMAGWHLTVPDWCGVPAEDMLPSLLRRPPGGTVYVFHDGSGDPIETARAVEWLIASTEGIARAVPLSEHPVDVAKLELNHEHSGRLGSWAQLSLLDLVVTGRLST